MILKKPEIGQVGFSVDIELANQRLENVLDDGGSHDWGDGKSSGKLFGDFSKEVCFLQKSIFRTI